MALKGELASLKIEDHRLATAEIRCSPGYLQPKILDLAVPGLCRRSSSDGPSQWRVRQLAEFLTRCRFPDIDISKVDQVKDDHVPEVASIIEIRIRTTSSVVSAVMTDSAVHSTLQVQTDDSGLAV